MKYLPLIAVVLLTVLPSNAAADQIPGADHPALRAAALAWLAAGDPATEISALGEIASDGNIAARILTNRIFSSFGHLDFPNLSRAERRQLLPPDDDERARFFSPYPVDLDLLPSTIAHQQMKDAVAPEEWISGAQILLDFGLFDQLERELRIVLGNRPELDIEALRFLERYVGDDNNLRGAIWVFRALDKIKIDYFEAVNPEWAHQRRARWKQDPWSSEQYASFSQALTDGRWTAIRTLGFLSPIAFEAEFAVADPPNDAFIRWGEFVFSIASMKPGESIDISDTDFDALGQLIAKDAMRAAYLQPLLNSCEAYCADDVSRCLATGVLSGVDQIHVTLSQLDPVISSDEYYASERAARELTAMLGQGSRTENANLGGRMMPQCYQEAAARLVDLVYPPRE